MHAVGTVIDFEEDCMLLDGRIEKDSKTTCRTEKARFKKGVEEKRKEEYLEKQM